MPAERRHQGVVDTNIVILRRWIDPNELPEQLAITAVTLAELSAGPHQTAVDDHTERARRIDLLQRVEHEFDPLPFDNGAARTYGLVSAAVRAAGRTPRRRIADLMIASTAIARGLPLYTTNPDDFAGLDELLDLAPVRRPETG